MTRIAEEDRYERAVIFNQAQDPKALRQMKPRDRRQVLAPFPVHASQLVPAGPE